MGMWVGRGRKARAAYGFDDIALVPGIQTVNPNEVDISWELCGHRYELPIIAAAMDGVVDVDFAIAMGRLGGLAVLNLEGVFSRYANPKSSWIASSPPARKKRPRSFSRSTASPSRKS